jgi:hypothetical protein
VLFDIVHHIAILAPKIHALCNAIEAVGKVAVIDALIDHEHIPRLELCAPSFKAKEVHIELGIREVYALALHYLVDSGD